MSKVFLGKGKWITSLGGIYAVSFSSSCENKNKYLCDVLVVGGGVVGTAISHCLKKEAACNGIDVSVTLLEKGICGGGASGLSAGTIWSAGKGAIRLDSAHLNLCHRSMSYYETLQKSGYDCGLVNSGNLILACTDDEVEHIRQEYSALVSTGHVAQYLKSPTAIREVEPKLSGGSALAALYTPLSGYLEPMQAVCSMKECASDAGVQIFETSGVKKIMTMNDPSSEKCFRIFLEDERIYETNHLVIAAGVACPDLLIPLGLQVCRRTSKHLLFNGVCTATGTCIWRDWNHVGI